MKTGRKIFWGVLLILMALAMLVGQMGLLGEIGFWSILFSVALIGICIDGIFHRSYGTVLFSAAFFVIVNDKLLGLEAITPWTVLVAALLGTIGLSILFPQKKWKGIHVSGHHGWKGVTEENVNGEFVHFENNFNETIKYISSTNLHQVDIENNFGSTSIYFDNAVLKEHRAFVKVENSFGSTKLYVPADWKVVLNVDNAFGGTREKGRCNPTGENVLEISGSVSFGDMEIIYI